MGGRLFKNIGTGLLSSYKNQKVILKELEIPFTENWDDNADILQINTPWLNSIRLMKKARKQGKRIIVWSHTTVEDSIQVFRFVKYVAWLYKKYLIYAYNLADVIFSPSEYTKSLLVAYGIKPEKIVVMSNGIDLKKYYADEKLKESGQKKYDLNGLTIGTVGLAIPRKGIDTFCMLSEKFPKNQFRWFGAIYSGLIAKALPKNLPDNIKFTGYVDDIFEAFNSIDLFIFPSYEENEGMVILEAAALGLPILVRDIPVYNGWLLHGENCLKAKNDKEFEKYLKQMIDDENLRKKLSHGAKLLAKEKSIESIGKKTRGIYEKLLAEA
jgi:1,2-diacylglycerol-3-alpha-glucose alpha-1,2-glucosyltransferase